MKLADLKKEFAKEKISWRAQTVTKDGSKAMALAYIDARDVMNRLDEVCGAESWQDSYEIVEQRTICKLMIRVGDYWVCKSDGAGETQVEGDKGAMSDAFKRAAVKWGIGRYLYDMPAPWVPCESKEYNGKKQFKRFTADPWQFVSQKPLIMGALTKTKLEAEMRKFCTDLENVEDLGALAGLKESHKDALKQCEQEHHTWWFGGANSDQLGVKDRIAAVHKNLEENEQNPLNGG